jgi:hypothetical protein
MAYMNGLRSYGHRSRLAAAPEISKKRESTEKWGDALARAERALAFCREASRLGRDGEYEQAEIVAKRGIEELTER